VLSLRDENIKSASNSSVSINKPTQEAVISSTTSSHKETKSRRRKGDRKSECITTLYFCIFTMPDNQMLWQWVYSYDMAAKWWSCHDRL